MSKSIRLLMLAAFVLSGCNLPALTPEEPTPTAASPATAAPAADTPAATPTIAVSAAPSSTPLPAVTLAPTATQPGAGATQPPGAQPTGSQPPGPTAPPASLPPTATSPGPAPTIAQPTAEARALFEATFPGGSLSFRIGALSDVVIPKLVTLKGAECKEGGRISHQVSFEPPPEYPIKDSRFSITQGNAVTISGVFTSNTRAYGTVTVRLNKDGANCTVGPLNWAANGS